MVDIIQTTDLAKKYGNCEALKGLNLSMKPGVFGFVGPNGAGKTTTIKILLGLIRADRGSAYVLGLDCWKDATAIKKKVGVLHEKTTFHKYVSGHDHLIFIARLKGLSLEEAKTQVEYFLKIMDLSGAVDKAIGGYSAGMKQRLGIAQALIGYPELVIFDEPTSNLDPQGRAQILNKINELHRDHNMNFLISTHVLSELEKICTHLGVIYQGVMIEQGSLEDLVQKYSLNTYKIIVSDPQILLHELEKMSYVEKIYLEKDTIFVKTRKIDELQERVSKTLHDAKIKLKLFKPADDELEKIYEQIMNSRVGEKLSETTRA